VKIDPSRYNLSPDSGSAKFGGAWGARPPDFSSFQQAVESNPHSGALVDPNFSASTSNSLPWNSGLDALHSWGSSGVGIELGDKLFSSSAASAAAAAASASAGQHLLSAQKYNVSSSPWGDDLASSTYPGFKPSDFK